MPDLTPSAHVASPEPHESAIGEGFRLIEYLMPSLPREAVQQLHDALGARLAMPSSSTTRRERLKVILDFIALEGRPPTASEYRADALARGQRGEQAIPLSTLEGYYGKYAQAVDAGVTFYVRGTAAKTQAGARAHKPPGFWTDEKCLTATDACRQQVGHWPSDFEFAALRLAGAKLCAANGWPGLDLPWPPVIARLFGSYGEMLETAKQRDRNRRATAAAQLAQDAPTTDNAGPQGKKGRAVRRRERSKNVSTPARAGGLASDHIAGHVIPRGS